LFVYRAGGTRETDLWGRTGKIMVNWTAEIVTSPTSEDQLTTPHMTVTDFDVNSY